MILSLPPFNGGSLTLVVASFIAIVSSVSAQSPQGGANPTDFYDSNYAEAPAYGADQQPQDETGSGREQPGEVAKANPNGAPGAPQNAASRQASSEDPLLAPRVDVFVNSLDRAHLSRAVDAIIKFHQSGKGKINRFDHIGDHRNFTPDMLQKLTAAGIRPRAAKEPAPDIAPGVTSSPTWVFLTINGKYIVEGTFTPERFVDDFGDFTDPVIPTPTPEPGMAGF